MYGKFLPGCKINYFTRKHKKNADGEIPVNVFYKGKAASS